MNANQVDIPKSQMIKISDDKVMAVSFVYHTKKGNDVKSFYKFIAHVDSLDAFKQMAEAYKADPTASEPWVIPCLEGFNAGYDGYVYTKGDASKFINTKIKKMLDWDAGMQKLNGFKRTTKTYNENAKYQVTGYVNAKTAETVDINNLEKMTAIENGTYLVFDVPMKRQAK